MKKFIKMEKEKIRLLKRISELQHRSIVDEKLTIGGVYHLLEELQDCYGKLEEFENGKRK